MTQYKLTLAVELPEGADPALFLQRITKRAAAEMKDAVHQAAHGLKGFGAWEPHDWVTTEDWDSGDFEAHELEQWHHSYTLGGLDIEPTDN